MDDLPNRVVIVGGGMVGATLALALANAGQAVTLIEANTLSDAVEETKVDGRSLTLSLASTKILQSLGLWSQLQGIVCPIRQIHVSRQSAWGQTLLRADDHHVDALGYVVQMQCLKPVLLAALKRQSKISLIDGATVTEIQLSTQANQPHHLCYQRHQQPHRMQAHLIVAADGSNSAIRRLLQLPCDKHHYDQWALVTTVGLKRGHQHTAYERFCDGGLMALIPSGHLKMGMIWTGPKTMVDDLLAMNDAHFLAVLQQSFGYRAGRFTAVELRHRYPLIKTVMPRYSTHGVVFVGNASQTVHPVAGQGLNLGLRDAAWLAEMIIKNKSIASLATLPQRFINQRYADRQRVIKLTHRLATWPSKQATPLGWLHALGMGILDLLPFAQRPLVQQAMGFGEPQQSCLSVGLSPEECY